MRMPKGLEHSQDGTHYTRNPSFACFHGNGMIGFIGTEGQRYSYSGPEAAVAEGIWKAASEPVPVAAWADLLERCETGPDAAVGIFEAFLERGLLLKVQTANLNEALGVAGGNTPGPRLRLLVCVTGAVAAVCIAEYLRELWSQLSAQIRVVLTRAATEMVNPAGLSYLLKAPCHVDMFEATGCDGRPPHIYLAEWASCVLVVPATANSIVRIASGTFNDLVSLTVGATPAQTPVIIAPSMNWRMFQSEVLQKSLQVCRENGYWIIEAGYGCEIGAQNAAEGFSVGALGCRHNVLPQLVKQILQWHRGGRARRAVPSIDGGSSVGG